ncbi:MAG TPA: YdcF family protein [Spirochaetia bacterium]|nr:YdcF family protein [Spirochaetia bacterium]
MLELTRIGESLSLPPGGLIALAVLGLILLAARRRRLAIGIFVLALAGAYALSIQPVANAIMVPLEDAYPPFDLNQAAGADAVVVLGGGSIAGAPDARLLRSFSAEHGSSSALAADAVSVSSDAAARLVFGLAVSRATALPLILAGGAPLRKAGTESEAEAGKELLVAVGADPGKIRTETASRTTWENAVNVALEYRPRRIVLVTSAYHMRRAVYSFRKQGIAVVPAPTDYQVDRGTGVTVSGFLPSASALELSATAIRERMGMLFYHLKYGPVPP